MGIGQLGSDEELKVVVVGQDNVAKFEHQRASLLEHLSVQNGIQGGVQFGTDVLDEDRLPEPDGRFQGSQQVPIRQFADQNALIFALNEQV